MEAFNMGVTSMMFTFLAVWFGLKPVGRIVFHAIVCNPVTDVLVTIALITYLSTKGFDSMATSLGLGVGFGVSSRIWAMISNALYTNLRNGLKSQLKSKLTTNQKDKS